MEESQMSQMSTGDESQLGSTTRTPANEYDERRQTIIIVICCLLFMLFLLVLLMLFGLFESASDVSETAGTKEIKYASFGGGVDTTRSTTSSSSDFAGPSSHTSHLWTESPTLRGTPSSPNVTTILNTTTPSSETPTSSTLSTTIALSTPTTTTTREDRYFYTQNYGLEIWTYLHKYLCPFWADKQGFRSHRRTYGIAFFPYMFCHYAMYCCYSLDDSMQLQPELPDVDLPPRDAVRRMANFKTENPFLEVWLVVRGPDSVFLKLLANANNEKTRFQNNALAWMKANNYDAIRMWWNNAPDSLNRSLAELYNETNDVFMQHSNRTFGFLFPYGHYVRAAYNTSKLAHRRAYHTIVMYQEYPRNITNRKATTYTIRELKVYSKKLNQTDRPAFCHLYPFVALTYKIDPAKCLNGSSSKPYNIQPLGYGPPGPITKIAGILSLPEVCDILDSSWNQTSIQADSPNFRPNYQFACKGEDAIAYTNQQDVYYNLQALDQEFEEEVFGVMNPEYDDFPNVCPPPLGTDEGFPMVQAAFQIMYH
ncbi:hypothetical protein HPB49_013359 [Dermacentor silvarum]|uniref:Uncharacterized protein n=2 Tax=Dermacentor silvarum TaxID=543639 RepID=A0ACB8DPG5_DERSI|nr:hypothetical protein HPB49_009565 [Dermacentor silvarum]KAH7974263.1 hypothetical protein HPB49_013359 [Dermacentor silvarum]